MSSLRINCTAVVVLLSVYIIFPLPPIYLNGIRHPHQTTTKQTQLKEHDDFETYIYFWERLWRSLLPNNYSGKDDASALSSKTEKKLLAYSESLKQLNSTTTSEVGQDFIKLFKLFPAPKNKKSMAIYNNKGAYHKLIAKMIQARSEGRKFTIVASGGSTTAGGGSEQVAQKDRYYSRFGKYLNILLSANQTAAGRNNNHIHETIQWIGQGHGTRNSLHSALLFDNFIPHNETDLILWEFSINDAAAEDVVVLQNSKQSFLTWIHEVSKMRKEPPIVLLIYYWDTPFHHDDDDNDDSSKKKKNNNMEIVGQSFQSHGDIAQQFDFVVGHINVASYVDELGLKSCSGDHMECPFLSDRHHASRMGHFVTTFLLLNFLKPTTTTTKAMQRSFHKRPTFLNNTNYEWNCGVETEEKMILKDVLTNSTTGWKSPLGGWTLELPVVDQVTPRRLVVARRDVTDDDNNIEIFGRIRPLREDRQRCTPLSHCGSNETESLFSLTVPNTSKPMKDARVLLFSFKYGRLIEPTEIVVRLNDDDDSSMTTAKGKLIPMRVRKLPQLVSQWPCHLSNDNTWGERADAYWFIFDKQQPSITSLSLCQPANVTKRAKIQSLLVW